MEMTGGKDSDWVNNLLQFYCKHSRITAILERAEINPKKRTTVCSYDSSTECYKINIVYKDSKGSEHELKWVIKVTRSDVNEVADQLLRHEKQVFSRLIGDLMNTVKQRSAGRSEGSRVSFRDLLMTPQFIYDETSHQADVMRNLLVLDNLEEKDFFSHKPGPMNLGHMKVVVKTIAKFHAVSLTYKQVLYSSLLNQEAQLKANRKIDEIIMEGDNRILTGTQGLFARFPFLANRKITMAHLLDNRNTFMDMFEKFLSIHAEESHLLDIFEYIRISADDILLLDENKDLGIEDNDALKSITLGILESRSFLFRYEDDEHKENEKKKKSSKLQRSQSERIKDRSRSEDTRHVKAHPHHNHPHTHAHHPHAKEGKKPIKQIPGATHAKCPKLENKSGLISPGVVSGGLVKNKFLQNVIGRSKDDEKVPLTGRKSGRVQKDRDPNQSPKRSALVNAKYVTYGPITRDLAVVLWTCPMALVRRYYLIKMVECYAEALGIALGQLGIDSDCFGVKYQQLLLSFQNEMLYGFLVSVLLAMATTSPEDLEKDQGSDSSDSQSELPDSRYLPLTQERVKFMLDLMKDIGSYVESKDFEQGLPITNFARYHELWSMEDDDEESEEDEESE